MDRQRNHQHERYAVEIFQKSDDDHGAHPNDADDIDTEKFLHVHDLMQTFQYEKKQEQEHNKQKTKR
ncbi:hypothetical protein EPH95_12550 [Salicibibacter halophilus]|uniref:Uncharacterized protein n=1 Tax=Salicibibacter halophilus TaxID=2502791 RepID=A0A514LJ76_9BACI|nr:hypothetical protein EPH95_12550 [Salicibibacter halophilus]